MKPAGLILSAGESRRMGSPKALLDCGGQSFLDRLILLFSAFCAPVVIVLGHEAGTIRAGLRHSEKARIVVNRNYPLGQLSSMQCGLEAVPAECGGALFTLVDHPAVRAETIRRILDKAASSLVIPRYEGRPGHPIWIGRGLFADFLSLPADSQARAVIQRRATGIDHVDVNDPGILDDIDDPAAYRRLRERMAGS